MSDCTLTKTLRDGLSDARKNRGELTAIINGSGLCASTVTKFLAGSTSSMSAHNLERLWCVLARRGYTPRTFRFPVSDCGKA